MQTTLISVFIATFIINAVAWNRSESFQDNFDSKRNYMIDDDEQDLLQQLQSLFHHRQKRSWKDYVDVRLNAPGLQSAAIIGLDGNTWASRNFKLRPGEGRAIAQLFKNPANVSSKGVTVNGIKYMVIKNDDRSIYGRKGASGVVLAKTKQAIIIGVYNEKITPPSAARIVEKLADDLIGKGF